MFMRFTDIVFLIYKKHSGWGQIGFGWEGADKRVFAITLVMDTGGNMATVK